MSRWDDLDPFQQWSVRYAMLGQRREQTASDADGYHDSDASDAAAARFVDGAFGAKLVEDFEAWARDALGQEQPFELFIPPDRQLITDLQRFDDARIKLLQQNGDLRRLKPREFEELVAALWTGFGYDVELTKQTRDGGKDIIAISRRPVQVKFLIECKAPTKADYVGPEPVRALLGVRELERATKGILATTVRFSPTAKAIFEQSTWELEGRDRDGVLEWIREYLTGR